MIDTASEDLYKMARIFIIYICEVEATNARMIPTET